MVHHKILQAAIEDTCGNNTTTLLGRHEKEHENGVKHIYDIECDRGRKIGIENGRERGRERERGIEREGENKKQHPTKKD
jgi:hypothetical protein